MTAVEKLELSLLGLISFDSEELRAKYKERVAKAKELEKLQMESCAIFFTNYAIDRIEGKTEINGEKQFEEYYKETFNK